ncbi:MAG: hypothetical protein IJ068_01445 [Bacilli bacterium]|nr:hypothetical protein [Bacilli bacterium]
MKIISKIKLDNSFYLFLILIILTGMFKEFSFVIVLLIFHELGHAITGKLLKWNLVSITFYPYGGVTLFEKLENSSIKEELIILLMGPIIQIITYLILIYFFKYSYIKNYHMSILIFNMLPILPLDGGKLLNLILNKKFNYLNSFYISFIISFITIFLLILFCIFYYHNLNLFLMSIFLIFKIINSLKNIKYNYNKFLLERYLYNFNFRKYKVSKDIYSFYKESNHYIEFQTEKKYLKKYFQS